MSYRFTPCFLRSSIPLLTAVSSWLRLAIALPLTAIASCSNAPTATAQVIPDTTLGPEASQLTPNVIVGGDIGDRIDGGAARNTFLFHSFDQFNINDGQRVYFGNPDGIETIFSRVTGNDISDILGTLGVDGTADLLFLNPSGIVFGPNAELDVSGSFVATTADGFTFGDNVAFSVTNPEAPPLLKVTAPIGLQFGSAPGTIRNEGFLLTIGQPVTFAGGDIEIDGGTLFTFLGQTELAAVGGPGTVQVGDGSGGEEDRLSIPATIERGNITLSNGAQVQAVGGPNAIITAEDLNLLDSSRLRTGILGGFEDISNEGGDVIVDLSGTLDIQNASGINTVLADGTTGENGNIFIDAQDIILANESEINSRAAGGGNITLTTNNLTLRNDSAVRAGILIGSGNVDSQGGDVTINAAASVVIDDGSAISNILQDGATGINGDIVLKVGEDLTITEDSAINTGNFVDLTRENVVANNLNAGDVVIDAGDTVVIRNTSGIRADNQLGTGDAGMVSITSNSLLLENNSDISANLFFDPTDSTRQGRAGTIQIQTNQLTITGDDTTDTLDAISAGAFIPTDVTFKGEETESRNGGQIAIQANTVQLDNRVEILAESNRGNGGDITIDATGEVAIGEETLISALSGRGDGGDILVLADRLTMDDSTIASNSLNLGTSGTITLDVAGRVDIINGGGITAGAPPSSGDADDNESDGASSNGGNIAVNSDRLILRNRGAIDASGIGAGDAGNIVIDSNRVRLLDGGQISAFTNVDGEGGDITIRNADYVEVSGFDPGNLDNQSLPLLVSSILTVTSGDGAAGDIRIDTRRLRLQNGGGLGANTLDRDTSVPGGQSGNIFINASESIEVIGTTGLLTNTEGNRSPVPSSISTVTSNDEDAGDITINTRRFRLQDGAFIVASTRGAGSGGQILVDASESVEISGIVGGPSTIAALPSALSLETTGVGNAGELMINTGHLSLQNGGTIFALTTGRGTGGTVTINESESVTVRGFTELATGERVASNITVATEGAGTGGKLSLNTDSLAISDGGRLNASTGGNANAGEIDIRVNDSINLRNGGLIQTSINPGAMGNAGDINIKGRSLTLNNGSQIVAGVFRETDDAPGGRGRGGNIRLNILDSIDIAGVSEQGFSSGVITNTASGASGRGGDISVETGQLRLTNGGAISARTANASRGGNISVVANAITAQGGGQILTSTLDEGRSGNIDITVSDRLLLEGNDPTFAERLDEFGRDITVPVSANSGIFANAAVGSSGNAGQIRLNTDDLAIQNQAEIASSSLGAGDADNIDITADTIALSDRATITAETRNGTGGDVAITADWISLSDRSRISAETQSGEGGDINIQANDALNVLDSEISASTQTGVAGNMEITAIDSVLLRGTGGLSVEATGETETTTSFVTTRQQLPRTTRDLPTAGSLILSTGDLQVLDGANITVSSPTGFAGELTIAADQLQLDDGELVAIAGASDDGNNAEIRLAISDLIRLQNESLISAEALNNADGGNIIIFNPDGFIVGARLENSDIVADANLGRGGDINIVTQGIYGLEVREARSPFSDITASSEAGVDGTIVIETPNIEPERGALEPPTLVDGSQLVSQSCPSGLANSDADNTLGQFTVTGRGGLPTNPEELMDSNDILTDWITVSNSDEPLATASVVSPEEDTSALPVEAQGFRVMENGAIALMSQGRLSSPDLQTSHPCPR
ncbi:MAG: filamentous hemagglutinin N-terminal domain-containing protein [Cyanobacteria bacterium P01_F01_bin.150]